MRHAYMIMAHAQPELLKKLLCALDHEDNDVIIHLDIKSPLSPDLFMPCIQKGRLYFTDRLFITWAHFDIIRAEYCLLEKALSVGIHDYYHFITGQDFPLKPVQEINAFFHEHAGKEFVHFCSAEFACRNYVNRFVVKQPFLKKCGRTKNIWYFLNDSCVKVQKLIYKLFKPRWSPEQYLIGSQFFSITQACAEYIVGQKRTIFKQYKATFCSDESVIQTLVYNSKFKESLYVPSLDNGMMGNMRYIDWLHGRDGSPATITIDDVPRALESGMMFTRKVDIINHPDAIEAIELAIQKS